MADCTLKAYTAGLLDGEGSIQINPTKGQKKRYWGLTVQLSSNCYEAVEYLNREWVMGSITSWRSPKSPTAKTSYNWRLYGAEAERLLTAIQPWLLIKQENAICALAFRTLVAKKRDDLTPQLVAQRNELAMQMRELNRKYGKGLTRPFPQGVL